MTCEYEVKPFHHEWCGRCAFNGCYPWNENPLLLCQSMGGFQLVIELATIDKTTECLSCKPVTEDLWQSYVNDKKREAKYNEEIRLRAMQGKILSNNPLPAEKIASQREP